MRNVDDDRSTDLCHIDSDRMFTPKDMALYGIGMTVLAALIIGVWLTVFGIV